MRYGVDTARHSTTHKKKTKYDIVKTMNDRLLEYNIREEGGDNILQDFKKVLIVLDKRSSKPYHVGSYDYFIQRLASRWGIEIKPLSKEEVEHRESREIEKRVEETVRREYKKLPYGRMRAEEMWDKLKSKIADAKKKREEASKIKPYPVDTKTQGTLQKM